MNKPKLIDYTDFVGEINLQITSENLDYVNEILAINENKLLRLLLGDWLANELINALVYNSETQRYELSIYDYPKLYELVYGGSYFNTSGKYVSYDGILDFIRYQCFYAFCDKNQNHSTSIGMAQLMPESSKLLSNTELQKEINKRWNISLDYYYFAVSYINNIVISNYTVLFPGEEGARQVIFWNPPKLEMKGMIINSLQ